MNLSILDLDCDYLHCHGFINFDHKLKKHFGLYSQRLPLNFDLMWLTIYFAAVSNVTKMLVKINKNNTCFWSHYYGGRFEPLLSQFQAIFYDCVGTYFCLKFAINNVVILLCLKICRWYTRFLRQYFDSKERTIAVAMVKMPLILI